MVPVEYRKTKTEVMTLGNQKGRRHIHWTNQNSEAKEVADAERGKTWASEPRFGLVLLVIEWQNSASF